MDRLKVAILGATGTVGKELIRMIENHPYFELSALYASKNSAGSSMEIGKDGISMEVRHADAKEISKQHFDFIFSAVSEQSAAILERELREMGSRIITNASGNRMLPDVPIVVPEINFKEISKLDKGYILANGNCSTIGLVLGLAPVGEIGIKSVNVTTLQAVSGAGYPGTPSLDILSNVIPYIQNEEEKIVAETHKILASQRMSRFRLTATCTRVPVLNGHLESVTVELNSCVGIDEILDSYRLFKNNDLPSGLPTLPVQPIILHEGKDRPQPRLDSGKPGKLDGMQVSIGRVRLNDDVLQFVLVVDNLIRGAAGSTLLNAEVAATLGGYL
jgi:aspartate-semialdehyde dehydrogenase